MENTLLQNDLVEQREGFKIENLEGATWAFRKLRAIENKESEIKAIAEKEISTVTTWMNKEIEQYSKEKEFFNYLLQEFYRTEKAKDKKFKLSTPYGKVTSKTGDKYFYDDEKAIIEYCDLNNIQAIKVKKELDKPSFKKACAGGINQETGEVIPGVRVEKTETITVKVEV